MKATGIVRRIDELGRVVIPKEIRRTLRIKEGDPLEIFTDRDELTLKKYSPIATLERFSEATARSLHALSGKLAVICDTDEILYAYGEGKKDFAGKRISDEMDKILKERRSYLANASEGGDVIAISIEKESGVFAQIIVPIIMGGDCLGAVVLLSKTEGEKMDANDLNLARLTADILSNQFE
ncbi:MAG: AbrB/MazE/SpoVT family DNA-binding domain-containing protein [Clostridia bacterium]|nr:AbrB/MazE/SpoVT family DNA-binding domain-containing protein [Clostridia bacterium]